LTAARIRGAALTALCLCFGPVIYDSARAAAGAMLLLAVAALFTPESNIRAVLTRAGWRLALLLPLLLWMLLSALWSFDGGDAVSLALRLAALALGGMLLVGQFTDLPIERLRRPLLALAIGLSLASALVALDLQFGLGFGRALHPPVPEDFDPALYYGRAASLHAIFVIPMLLALVRLRAPLLGLLHTVLAGIAIFETSTLSAKTALAIGLLTLILVYVVPRLRWAGLALLGLAVVALPLIFPLNLGPETRCWLIDHKPSALHRVLIWNFVTRHIDERPITGWGLDAARRLPGGKDPVTLYHCPPDPAAGQVALSSEALPLHPHNGILQVWLELGGIGAALGFVPFFLGIARLFRMPGWRTRLTQAMFAAAITSALSVSLVSFGIWQEWYLGGLFIVAALAVLAARAAPAKP
jgi:exopolysaccharide production protein ExoQ